MAAFSCRGKPCNHAGVAIVWVWPGHTSATSYRGHHNQIEKFNPPCEGTSPRVTRCRRVRSGRYLSQKWQNGCWKVRSVESLSPIAWGKSIGIWKNKKS